MSRTANATEIDGFTEPYRTVNVATAEAGIITELSVKEGDLVRAGQVLGTLDIEVLEAGLAVAKAQMEAQGALQAAQADVALYSNRIEQLEMLRPEGHASQQELNEARAQLQAAEARVLAARELIQVRTLEVARIEAQIRRRQIQTPIDGVVTRIHKEVGEYAAPTDPVVLTVVALDKLLATFSVPAEDARRFHVDQNVRVKFTGELTTASGTVEHVSPVIEAESGTVRVKVRLANIGGRYRSGQRCALTLPTGQPERLSERP